MSDPTNSVSLRHHGTAFMGVAVLSALVNVLHLSGSIFMLEVYDRVLPGRSVPTLIGLGIILVALYAFQAVFDIVRGRIMSRIGTSLDESLGETAFRLVLLRPIRTKMEGDGQQPLRDLDKIRGFLSSGGPAALFDLPWMPLYLIICFAFHFWIGMTATIGAVVLVVLTLLTEIFTRRTVREAATGLRERSSVTQAGQRNAEVIHAMGMSVRFGQRWAASNRHILAQQQRVSDVGGGFGSLSRVFRMLLQSSVLAVGAYLVIGGEVTAGVMIASSILASRALAPVELAIANWKGFVGARQSWKRLRTELSEAAIDTDPLPLPVPKKSLDVEAVSVNAPGGNRCLIEGVNFSLAAGDGLGIIGPSGSGKSTIARALVGVWPPQRGKIRLDGGALDQWSPCRLGLHIGYLPQDVELFEGTIAQNIGRFDPEAVAELVIAAARAADVHEMILRLPQGYETELGMSGMSLSGGQRQRIALARALYGDPFLVVLDEPNSNLDNEGEIALSKALKTIKSRGGIAIVVAHRPAVLACLDQVLVLGAGRQIKFGPKAGILSEFTMPAATAQGSPLRLVDPITPPENAQ